MSKKAITKILSSLPGFRSRGPFYIGMCNQEVISGYVLDAPPNGVCIWRFILPAYDRIEFLHMGLGQRIAEFFGDERALEPTDLSLLLKNDWQEFSGAHEGHSLMAYLDREQVQGDYCQWTKFLTSVRVGELESARRYELQWQSSSEFPRVQLVAENLEVVLEAKERAGWNGVQELLSEWSKHTVAKFCQQRI